MKKITSLVAIIFAINLGAGAQTTTASHTNASKAGKKLVVNTANKQQGSSGNSLNKNALNPQPLPPKTHVVTQKESLAGSSGNSALNPQPLPPKTHVLTQNKSLKSSVNNSAINPQPLPPKTPTKGLRK